MPGLLDFIFDNIDIATLERPQVEEYTTYLKEIEHQNLPLNKKVKFLSLRVRLQQRLLQLDINRTSYNDELITQIRRR